MALAPRPARGVAQLEEYPARPVRGPAQDPGAGAPDQRAERPGAAPGDGAAADESPGRLAADDHQPLRPLGALRAARRVLAPGPRLPVALSGWPVEGHPLSAPWRASLLHVQRLQRRQDAASAGIDPDWRAGQAGARTAERLEEALLASLGDGLRAVV